MRENKTERYGLINIGSIEHEVIISGCIEPPEPDVGFPNKFVTDLTVKIPGYNLDITDLLGESDLEDFLEILLEEFE